MEIVFLEGPKDSDNIKSTETDFEDCELFDGLELFRVRVLLSIVFGAFQRSYHRNAYRRGVLEMVREKRADRVS